MNVGDVVFLNSNPEILMTVEFVLGSETSGLQERMLDQQMKMRGYADGDVYCTWFENKELKHEFFKKQMLTKK
ncbi:MAG: hypothetical protein IK102_07750 [Treponema sp.]|nr:hypothetical protein [Treponema sp.]